MGWQTEHHGSAQECLLWHDPEGYDFQVCFHPPSMFQKLSNIDSGLTENNDLPCKLRVNEKFHPCQP
jgi:hypothetical protein